MKDLIKSDWYDELIEDCRAIIAEAHFSVQTELLKGKWEIGKRIMQDELQLERAGYGEQVVEALSGPLEVSPQTLWKCIQFYKKFKFEDFSEVMPKIEIDGKTPSWYRVCREVLPEHKQNNDLSECKHEQLMCLKCRKHFRNDKTILPKTI